MVQSAAAVHRKKTQLCRSRPSLVSERFASLAIQLGLLVGLSLHPREVTHVDTFPGLALFCDRVAGSLPSQSSLQQGASIGRRLGWVSYSASRCHTSGQVPGFAYLALSEDLPDHEQGGRLKVLTRAGYAHGVAILNHSNRP